jgi:hypothetical protein
MRKLPLIEFIRECCGTDLNEMVTIVSFYTTEDNYLRYNILLDVSKYSYIFKTKIEEKQSSKLPTELTTI